MNREKIEISYNKLRRLCYNQTIKESRFITLNKFLSEYKLTALMRYAKKHSKLTIDGIEKFKKVGVFSNIKEIEI